MMICGFDSCSAISSSLLSICSALPILRLRILSISLRTVSLLIKREAVTLAALSEFEL